ncbi:hypothetical protein ZHAS_00014356 [Anopheles sinensis]|uniref:Uncharacterized protein n=1 Tax=Anopheles sinensis TaxID=74873 RepID=A0A084W821_ANOSI|nr:hypothetical protein ZHAS_00014356 [Anopheles sinensis]
MAKPFARLSSDWLPSGLWKLSVCSSPALHHHQVVLVIRRANYQWIAICDLSKTLEGKRAKGSELKP